MKRKYEKNLFVYLIMGIAIAISLFEMWNNEKAKECKEAYDRFLEEQMYNEDFYYPEDVRYEYVFIDKDNIPELLLADGDSHVSRVGLYTYNKKLKQVDFLASFSSFGEIQYVPKGNTIISQYGNHGYYHQVYSKMEDNEIHLKAIFLSDGSKGEQKYYGGFSVNEDFTGGYGKSNSGEDIFDTLPEGTEEYRISEEEYEKLTGELEAGSISIGYDDMQRL